MEVTKQITAMEEILNRHLRQVEQLSPFLEACQEQLSDLAQLFSYYGSDQWHQHLEMDQNNEIPKGLPRGVLSEDGIYNLIIDYRELAITMRDLANQIDQAIDQD